MIGAEAIQLFVSNPRAWALPGASPAAAREFAERRAGSGVGPVFVHTTYLVNIASPDPGFWRRSIDLARAEMRVAAAIGADGLIVHAGAGGRGERGAALARAAAAAREIAGEGGGPQLLLELTAGGAGTVASTIPGARELLRAIGDHPRVALCLDTCHLFAAGYPLDEPDGVRATFAELADHGLAGRLGAVHANDARAPRGSRLDRHEHIGEGRIGDRGFRAILAEPAVRTRAVLVETPGRLEDHRRNIERLRALAPPGA